MAGGEKTPELTLGLNITKRHNNVVTKAIVDSTYLGLIWKTMPKNLVSYRIFHTPYKNQAILRFFKIKIIVIQ